MAIVDLVMPKMGESIMEATILKWLKQPGDPIKMDETVLEIATDKVDSEVPSTAEGVLSEILFNVNDVVPIGTVIARIKTGADAGTAHPAPQQTAPAVQVSEQQSKTQEVQDAKPVSQQINQSVNSTASYSPSSNGNRLHHRQIQ